MSPRATKVWAVIAWVVCPISTAMVFLGIGTAIAWSHS